MSPTKKTTPIPEAAGEKMPVEPAMSEESISQVAGRGSVQPEVQPAVTPSPPLIPVQPTVLTPPPASTPADQLWMYDPHLNDNMPAAQDTTITLLRTTTYQMPGTCPICNEPRLGGTGKIHTTNSYQSGNMKYTLSLDFPICKKCTDVQAIFTKNSTKGASLGIPFGVVALAIVFIAGMSGSSGSSFGEMVCPGLIVGLVAWGIAFAIINAILNSKLPKPLKDRNARIAGSVSISSFNPTHVSFKFKNNIYAAAFQLLNSMGGQNLMQQMLDTLNKKQPT